MGNEIHAIRKPNGCFLYRSYSTTSDMYLTPALNEGEMSLYLLYAAAKESLATLSVSPLGSVNKRLERARESGTSDRNGRRSLKSWEKRPQDYWGDRFAKEKTKKALLADISEYLAAPLHKHIAVALRGSQEASGQDFHGRETEEAQTAKAKIEGLIALLPK
jgi:hypothetical protein